MTDETQLSLFPNESQDREVSAIIKRVLAIYKDKTLTQEELEALAKTIARNARVLMLTGVAEDEAEEKAVEQYISAFEKKSQKQGRIGETPIMIKEYLKQYFGKRNYVCASDVFDWAKKYKGYKAKRANGLGDALGRGGLFLEEIGRGSQKQYKIPDPVKYASWYENHEEMLPKDYYSSHGFEKLIQAESLEKNSRFMDWHAKQS